ncbi:hypothetical protein [Streptomyces sp. NPDC054784]
MSPAPQVPRPAADGARRPSRWAPARWKPVGLLLVGALLATCCYAVPRWPRTDVVHRSTDAATGRYDDDSRHHAGLVRKRTLSGSTSYTLVVGRDPGLSYGHALPVSPYLAEQGVADTDWTAAGVRVEFTTGHALFVPASAFTHGR